MGRPRHVGEILQEVLKDLGIKCQEDQATVAPRSNQEQHVAQQPGECHSRHYDDDEPERLECEACGKGNTDYDAVPSMAGHGFDWSITCRDCGHAQTGHPDVS